MSLSAFEIEKLRTILGYFDNPEKLAESDIILGINNKLDGVTGGYQGKILKTETPTENGFYSPLDGVIHPNFGNLEFDPATPVAEGGDQGVLVFFIKKDAEYSKISIDLNIIPAEVISENNKKYVNSGLLWTLLQDVNSALGEKVNTDDITEFGSNDINDADQTKFAQIAAVKTEQQARINALTPTTVQEIDVTPFLENGNYTFQGVFFAINGRKCIVDYPITGGKAFMIKGLFAQTLYLVYRDVNDAIVGNVLGYVSDTVFVAPTGATKVGVNLWNETTPVDQRDKYTFYLGSTANDFKFSGLNGFEFNIPTQIDSYTKTESNNLFETKTDATSKNNLKADKVSLFTPLDNLNVVTQNGLSSALINKLIIALQVTSITENVDGFLCVAQISVTTAQRKIDFDVYQRSNAGAWGSSKRITVFYSVDKNKIAVGENVGGDVIILNEKHIDELIAIGTSFSSLTEVGRLRETSTVEGYYPLISNLKNISESKIYPKVVLPQKVYAVVGKEFNLYYDTFCLTPNYADGLPQFLFDIDCSVGAVDTRSFRFTPVAGNVGNHVLKFKILDNDGNVYETHTTTIVVVNASLPAVTRRISHIGDSTVDDTGQITKTLQENLAECTGTTPTFLGTHQIAPYRNEARSGKTWTHYATGDLAYRFNLSGLDVGFTPDTLNLRGVQYYSGTVDNNIIMAHRFVNNGDGTGFAIGYNFSAITIPTVFPATLNKISGVDFPATLTVDSIDTISTYSIFKDVEGTGVLNFENYRTEVLNLATNDKIDVMISDLGINDLSGVLQTTNLDAIIVKAKILIDAFFVDNPTGKFIISIPKSNNSANYKTGRDLLRVNVFNFIKLLIENFDFNANYPNVYLSQSGFSMDRFYGYPLINKSLSSRYTETKLTPNDDVHPRLEGYNQNADGLTGCVVWVLNNF